MKKSFCFFAALSALAALAGCQKSEPATGLDGNDAIGFAPYVSRDVTKASVTDITADNLNSFNVMCYLTGSATPYFNSEQSASKNASGYWETKDSYYWLTNTNFDFFAYSGSGSGAISNTDGVAKVSYTVPDAATEDFIVASAVNQGKPSASPYAQSLSFSHVLSKVSQLTLASVTGAASADSKYKYIVTDVRISGAKNSADYTFNPDSGSSWGTASGSQDYAFEDIDFNFLGSSSHKLEAAADVNDQLIILPQAATFSVTYSVEYSYDGGTTWGEIMPSATKTADVEMEAGKAYNIKLQLPNDASPIVFSTNVAGWGDAVEVDKEIKKNIALSGNFTVNSSGDKVRFSPGNLYYTGSEFKFEENQYAYTTSYDASHVCRFRWAENSGTLSSDITSAISTETSLSGTTSDVFFTNATQTTPRADFTVEGETGKWRALSGGSSGEWYYLLSTRKVTVGGASKTSYGEGSVNGTKGLIILPDDWDGSVCSGFTYGGSSWSNVFTESTTPTWSDMESAGCVFLPAAGNRYGSSLSNVGSFGIYWSYTPLGTDGACSLSFRSGNVSPADSYYRYYGQSVRLVSAAQ